MYFGFYARQANTPLGLALGLAVIWEWHETKQQTTTAPQTSLDILKRLSCMQVCLEECHRVGMEALNQFPGFGASRPATTGALWPGPDSLCLPRRVHVLGAGKRGAGVLRSASGDGDVKVYVRGSVEGWEKGKRRSRKRAQNFQIGQKYTAWKEFCLTAQKNV